MAVVVLHHLSSGYCLYGDGDGDGDGDVGLSFTLNYYATEWECNTSLFGNQLQKGFAEGGWGVCGIGWRKIL